MAILTTEYSNVYELSNKFEFQKPQQVTLLPRNFADAAKVADLLHESTAETVKKVVSKAGIAVGLVEQGIEIKAIDERHFDWIAPLIFIPDAFAQAHPFWASLVTNALIAYLFQIFPGPLSKTQKIKIPVIVEKNGEFKKIEYEGVPENLNELKQALEEQNAYISPAGEQAPKINEQPE